MQMSLIFASHLIHFIAACKIFSSRDLVVDGVNFGEGVGGGVTCGVNDHTWNTDMVICGMAGRDDMHGAIGLST